MCLKRFLLVIAILFLPLAPPAAAHETDQFTMPADRQFADIGDYFTRWFYDAIDRGVQVANARIRTCIEQGRSHAELADAQSPDRLVADVNAQFPWAMDVIEGLETKLNSPEMRRKYPGQVVAYKQPVENILQHTHFFLDPRQLFRIWLGSTMKVHGVYMGTDKVGHFTDMGMNYYQIYRKGIRGGKTHNAAMADVLDWATHDPIFSERGMLGFATAGAYSNGDLAANYAGFLFYRNLTEPMKLKGQLRPPMLVRDGPFWKIADYVRRDSDFFAWFISDHLNEALNPSLFEPGMQNAVRTAVRERSSQVLYYYRDANGNIPPKEYFDQRLRELATYWGEDYGHLGEPDQVISIANTCLANPPPSQPLYAASISPSPNGLPTASFAARSPLHLAAASGNTAAAEQLLHTSASPSPRDHFNITPLHLAARLKDPALVTILLRFHAAVDSADDFGRTPLHDAARTGRDQIVTLLLQAGASPRAPDTGGITPLHLACRNDHELVARLLLAQGAPINTASAAGSTPLHEAALTGDLHLARLLFASGARSTQNRRGATPADIAHSHGHHQLAQLLRSEK